MASLIQVLMPKGKGKKDGVAFPPRYNPSQPALAAPVYNQHLTDLYNSRMSGTSTALLNEMVNHDPDVSSAIHSYLTIGGSSVPVVYAYDANNQLDPKGIELANQIIGAVTETFDYTQGFSRKSTLNGLANNLRYMLLLRGSVATELVLDKSYLPTELRLVDTATVQWRQPKAGVFEPYQKPAGSNTEIDLNVPTFFHEVFHQNPTDVYTFSPFVAAINTIVARTSVINDLYRIMKYTGYPRLDISIVQDVLTRNAPPAIRNDTEKMKSFVDAEMGAITARINNLGADQAFIHSDAIKAEIINDKNPGAGMQIQGVIDVLDAQNQAALKVMPAVVGKSDNGQTSSTESRLFALSTDALNRSVADLLTKALTFAVRLGGYQGKVVIVFPPVELRPEMELEPQKTMKAARLKEDLSLGLISDDEYHLAMYGRPRPATAPELSGTGFLAPNTDAAGVDASSVSPNSDPLGRSLAPAGGTKQAKSNSVKRGSTKAGYTTSAQALAAFMISNGEKRLN